MPHKAALLLAFLAGGAAAQSPAPDFAATAAAEIHHVVRFDPPDFTLAMREEAPFVFYGDAMNEFKQVKCERNAAFGIVALANMAGAINTGICTREARLVRANAVKSDVALRAVMAQLGQAGLKFDAAQLEKIGWKYARTDSGGAEEHYFPLVMIGHGILHLPTVVRVAQGSRRAIVVQADTAKLCENYGLQGRTLLCSDTRKALSQIARRIEARTRE